MKDLLFAVCMAAAMGTPMQRAFSQSLQGSRPSGICGSPVSSKPELMREAVSNTARLDPATYNLMKMRAEEKVSAVAQDTIGSEQKFFVYNFKTKSFYTVAASLMAKGILTEIWVDKAELSNGHVDAAVISSIKDALEDETPGGSRDTSLGIVPLEEKYFGMPPNTGYSNGYVHFLITDIKDNWDSASSGASYIAGFFQSNDQPDPNNGSYHSGSNKRDMLYIDSYPGIYYGGTRSPLEPLSTLAHELQHLIQWHYDPNEIVFFNEGCSTNAEVFCGYPLRSPSAYFKNTDVSLFTWRESTDPAVLADYSRAALFMRYLQEQFGDNFIRSFVTSPLHGVDAINSILVLSGSSLGFDHVFRNWIVANALNDTSAGRQYGYSYPIVARPAPSHTYTDPNVCLAFDTTAGLAADYVAFRNGDTLIVSYTSSGLGIAAVKSGSKPGVDILPSSGTFYEPGFGSTYSTVVLAIANTAGSGKGTMSFTGSGELSSIQIEEAYDHGTPDTLDGSTFIGLPDNRTGSGWAVEFTPPVPNYQLVSARIYAAFPQEFSGSAASPAFPKEFLFHIWSDRNGIPGPDLVTPFAVRVNRVSFDNDFIEVDLSSLSSQLSKLNGRVYVGFTENDTLSTSVGLIHSGSAGHSFAYIPSSGGWRRMSDLTIGGEASLSGWDLMMRADFRIRTLNTSPPKLAIGISQETSSSRLITVTLAADSALRPESICGSLAQGTGNTPLDFWQAGPYRFISSTVTLTNAGRTGIALKAAKLLGANYVDTTFTFNSAPAGPAEVSLCSPDSLLVLNIPAGPDDFFATAYEGTLDSIDTRAVYVYSLGPRGLATSKETQIRLSPAAFDTTSFAPAIYNASRWYGLPFRLENGTMTASTTLLSTFAVVPREIIDGHIGPPVPATFALHQNFPNPFNPSTTITFDLPRDSRVSLKIYDVLGRQIATVAEGEYKAGSYPVFFDASRLSLASGVYFCRIVTREKVAVRKMMLIK